MDIRYINWAGYQLSYTEVSSDTTVSGMIMVVWNGTGENDSDNTWSYYASSFGTETSESMHSGSNGLDSIGMTNGDYIMFVYPNGTVNFNNYGFLRMWIKIINWELDKEISIVVEKNGGFEVDVNLSRYLNIEFDDWQLVTIPITHFGRLSGDFNADIIKLVSDGNIDIFLDDIDLYMGYYDVKAICGPSLYGSSFGEKLSSAREIKPSVKAYIDNQTSNRVIFDDDEDSNRPFPGA